MAQFLSLSFNIDFAVGAPHDGNEQNGAIYIYLGNGNGRFPTYSQVQNLLRHEVRASM